MKTTNQAISFANAIFSFVKEKSLQEKIYQQISALDAINLSNTDFYSILAARSISKLDRKELAQKVLETYGFEKILIYWVWTIIDCNFYHKFHYIANACKEKYHNLFNITRIKITSASNLSEQQINKIKDFFTRKLNRKIDVEWHIKPSLIGGLQIQVNDKTYNNTIRGRIDTLKKQILTQEEQ